MQLEVCLDFWQECVQNDEADAGNNGSFCLRLEKLECADPKSPQKQNSSVSDSHFSRCFGGSCDCDCCDFVRWKLMSIIKMTRMMQMMLLH